MILLFSIISFIMPQIPLNPITIIVKHLFDLVVFFVGVINLIHLELNISPFKDLIPRVST